MNGLARIELFVKDDGAYSSDSNNSNMYLMIIFITIDYVVGKSLKK